MPTQLLAHLYFFYQHTKPNKKYKRATWIIRLPILQEYAANKLMHQLQRNERTINDREK